MGNCVYVLLSQTQTRFARAIRFFGKQEYNHVSISLDESFKYVYAFARPQHNALFLGRLVRESLVRYTLKKDCPVPVMILKIPVSNQEYYYIKSTITKMLNNPDYMYNLFSVLSYPVTKGIAVKNTFTCVEFVAYLLQSAGYLNRQESCHYRPDDLAAELIDYRFFEGDIRICLPPAGDNDKEGYFKPFTIKLFCRNIKGLFILAKRSFWEK